MELGKQRVLVRDINLEDYKGNWLYWNTAIKILESKREIQKDTCFFMNACQFQDLANDQIYQLLSFLSSDEWKLYCEISITAKSQEPSVPLWGLFFFLAYCWGPAWGTPPMAKVMRKERKHLLLLYWLRQSLCVDHNKLENSSRDGNTRPPYLPLKKPVCRSGSKLKLDMEQKTGSK